MKLLPEKKLACVVGRGKNDKANFRVEARLTPYPCTHSKQ